jgi:DNA invertase Pin-like site-specific DNA recombinase
MAKDQVAPAAEYVRMSTEHQQYSLENQSAAIHKYAELNGFQVVRTYSDEARSGLVLRKRKGLQQLLHDVVGGTAPYRAILVYDVSRWGRFQDTDESAHYEFLCKSAGVPVHYCAETFANDGSLPSLIMKALKRTMAGEYSRELGVKVIAGMRQLAALGFKQGGNPGYGLRRMLVSSTRQKKQLLGPGERKSITTDRVILVPGPPDEVQVVRDIYRMFVAERKSTNDIAADLTRKRVRNPSSSGIRWNPSSIHNILRHPRYSGINAFGLTSCRLKTPRVQKPRSEWVLTPGAFEPIVEPETFDRAQERFRQFTINRSNNELLEVLRTMLRKHRRLNSTIIMNSPEAASFTCYSKRFGSLVQAFALAGYGRPEQYRADERQNKTKALRRQLIAQIEARFAGELAILSRGRRYRSQLRLCDGLVVSVVIARCRKRPDKSLYWEIRPSQCDRGSLTLLARLNEKNGSFLDYHIMPNFSPEHSVCISLRDPWLKRVKRLQDISQFCEAIEQVRVSR